mmetsp:Transcript_53445/g.125701  ORF Transcript_53445/g.125701 Transcript_53445/m.125701 type:complete len:200 (-) Transcript_53445:1090-1689(-)
MVATLMGRPVDAVSTLSRCTANMAACPSTMVGGDSLVWSRSGAPVEEGGSLARKCTERDTGSLAEPLSCRASVCLPTAGGEDTLRTKGPFLSVLPSNETVVAICPSMTSDTSPGAISRLRARSYSIIALSANTVACVLLNRPSLHCVAKNRMAASVFCVNWLSSWSQVMTATLVVSTTSPAPREDVTLVSALGTLPSSR